ncbi:hypothetical protein Daqu01_03236 [Deinococcus aquaticus]
MDRHTAKAGGIDLQRKPAIHMIQVPLGLLLVTTVMVSCDQRQSQLIDTFTVAGVQLDLGMHP